MSNSPLSVWLSPLGHVWKVRLEREDDARQLRQSLTDLGYHCTMVTPAFDRPGTSLFRASNDDILERPALDEELRKMIPGIQLVLEGR